MCITFALKKWPTVNINANIVFLFCGKAGFSFGPRQRMKHRDLFSRQWCDLVFEGRNKDYGAYKMRAETGSRYKWAVAGLFVLVSVMVLPALFIFILSRPQKVKFDGDLKKIVHLDGVRIKEARPVKRVAQNKKTADPAAEKIDEVQPEQITSAENEENAHPEELIPLSEKKQTPLKDSLEALNEMKLPPPQPLQQTEGVVLDSIPHHPDGIAGFMKWLHRTMVYPPACLRRKEAGNILVAFIVEPSGEVSDIHILQGASPELNNEVLRVLHMMPKWIPGQRNGYPVRAQVTLPIEFQLSDIPYN